MTSLWACLGCLFSLVLVGYKLLVAARASDERYMARPSPTVLEAQLATANRFASVATFFGIIGLISLLAIFALDYLGSPYVKDTLLPLGLAIMIGGATGGHAHKLRQAAIQGMTADQQEALETAESVRTTLVAGAISYLILRALFRMMLLAAVVALIARVFR